MTGRRIVFPAPVRGNMPSRKPSDLRHQDAATLTAAVGLGLAEAVRVTAGWSRRRLLDTALTLAVRNRWPQQPGQEHGAVDQVPDSYQPRLDALGPRFNEKEAAWTDDQLRAAHRAFNNKIRTDWATEGERIYQRLKTRRQRAIS